MTLPEYMKSIRAVAVMLDQRSMLQQTYTTGSLRPSAEFTTYAMSANPDYQELYRVGLRNRDYNFLLADYSFLQFAYARDGDDLSLRFAYYANPFLRPSTECELYDGADYELYLQLLEENDERSDALVIRYEVATRDYVELRHPAAHFHIGLHEGRWPVDKVLSPKAFTMLITKLYYEMSWSCTDDEQLAAEKEACEVLDASLFSGQDRSHLYLT